MGNIDIWRGDTHGGGTNGGKTHKKECPAKKGILGGGSYTRRDVNAEGKYTWRGRTDYIAYITSDWKSHKRVV